MMDFILKNGGLNAERWYCFAEKWWISYKQVRGTQNQTQVISYKTDGL